MAHRVHKENPIEATGERTRMATSEVTTERNYSIIFRNTPDGESTPPEG